MKVDIIKSINQRLSEETKKVSGTPKIATYDQLKAIGKCKSTSEFQQFIKKKKREEISDSLIEKLNRRLGEQELKQKFKDTEDNKSGGEEDFEFNKPEPQYKIDFAPLISSLKKEFGSDAFIKPEKDNGEVLCVYFDPDIYEVNMDKFNNENL